MFIDKANLDLINQTGQVRLHIIFHRFEACHDFFFHVRTRFLENCNSLLGRVAESSCNKTPFFPWIGLNDRYGHQFINFNFWTCRSSKGERSIIASRSSDVGGVRGNFGFEVPGSKETDSGVWTGFKFKGRPINWSPVN